MQNETTQPVNEEWEAAAQRARSLVARGEPGLVALSVAHPEEPGVVLSLGDGLGTGTRAGAIMARLISQVVRGPWMVVGLRASAGGKPTPRERDAAARVAAAARLVDVPFAGVLLVSGTTVVRLDPEV